MADIGVFLNISERETETERGREVVLKTANNEHNNYFICFLNY